MINSSNVNNLEAIAAEISYQGSLNENSRRRWSTKKLLAAAGYLNNLIYCGARSLNLFSKGFGKRVDLKGVRAARQLFTLTVPVTYTVKFLEKFWDIGCGLLGASSIRNLRQVFSRWGLFTYEKQEYKGRNRRDLPVEDRQYATYHDFDLSLALKVYELIEKLLIERLPNGFKSLPKHKGATCKVLYDAFFTMSWGMNRKGDETVGTQLTSFREKAMLKAVRAMDLELSRHNLLSQLESAVKDMLLAGFQATDAFMEEMISQIKELRELVSLDYEQLPY